MVYYTNGVPKKRKKEIKYKSCWYCGKKTKDKGGNLFCPKCEKIKLKEVIRYECENFYMKV